MKYVKLIGRKFTPGRIDMGLTLDVAAESVEVTVTAPMADAFNAENIEHTLFWVSPLKARGEIEVVPEARDDDLAFVFQLPAEAMLEKGLVQAELRLTATEEGKKVLVWHSEPLLMNVTESLDDSVTQELEIPKYKTVEVTVDTLNPGSDATGSAEHTADALKLFFGIPAGESGVWVGAEYPPDAFSVWINPDGVAGDGENAVLRVKTSLGQWVSIPGITGPAGESIDLNPIPDGDGNAVTGLTLLDGILTVKKALTFLEKIRHVVTGSGNAVTDVTVNGDTINIVKDKTFLTEHQDISRLQTKAILDEGGYFTTDTVEGALQEAGQGVQGNTQAVSVLRTGSPIVEVTESKTLGLSDVGTCQEVTADSPDTLITITIPAQSAVEWPERTEIEIMLTGESSVVIAAADGVTVNSMDDMREIAGKHGSVTLKRMAQDRWNLGGALA